MPALALALAGMVVVAYRPQRWYLAVPFFVAACYSKQTFVAAPAACLAWFLFQRKWKTVAGFFASMAAVAAVVFWFLQLRTGGLFAYHMLRDHPQPFLLRQFLEVIGKALPAPLSPFWRMAAFMLPLYGIVWLLLRNVVKRGIWQQFSLPVFYLVCTAGVSLITAPKTGSDTNHLLELLAAAFVCAGIGYVRLTDVAVTKPGVLVLPLLLSILTVAIAVVWRSPKFNHGSTAMLRDCDRAYAYVREHPGSRILAENLGALVLANKRVLVSPYLLAQIVRYAGWSDAPLVSQIRERQFEAIVLAEDVEKFRREGAEAWSPEVIAAIAENYDLHVRFQCRYATAAYEPKLSR
jgi:hypothetical protein